MELWHLLVAMAVMLAIGIAVAVYMNRRGKLSPDASMALQRVLAGDVHSVDDFVKAVLADPALKKQYADVLSFVAVARARAGAAAEHFIQPSAAGVPLRGAAQSYVPPVPPPGPDSDGIEAYAARAGIAAAEMRLAARLHPSYTWEQLAAWIKDPASSPDFTDADRDTTAAAAPHEPLNR